MLHIRLLGNPQIVWQGQPFRLPATPKLLSLWSYLLLQPAAVSRSVLAATLWPDVAEVTARANLRRHLHRLQLALPAAPPNAAWLVASDHTLQWNPASDYWLDVAEFERLSRLPDHQAEAVALYTGDLLTAAYDSWLIFERDRLREIYLAQLVQLIQIQRAKLDYPAAIAYAHQLLACDPLNEAGLRQLLAVQYEAGNRAAALAEYANFAALLFAELGVAPMPETTALYEAALHQQPLPAVLTLPQPIPATTKRSQPATLPLVGREQELAQLSDAWAKAAGGQGSTVLLTGEAGIGKTRLTGELAQLAQVGGGRVLHGDTTPAEPIPHQAIVAALHTALPLLAAVEGHDPTLRALLPLLPALASRRPDLLPLPPLDPQHERSRLYQALLTCLLTLAQPRPLLLILEDLHWAGVSTIDFLNLLTRSLTNQRLLVVATYRAEEANRQHPLRELRSWLMQAGNGHYLPLTRLTASAMDELSHQLPAFAALPPATRQHLYAESEGHPFFLSELLRELPHLSADLLPEGVNDLIARRLARLGANTRLLAEVAAVIGSSFNLELVIELAGWSEAQTLTAIDELLDCGLLREAGSVDYRFSHHLIQEYIYAALDEGVRRRRHRRTALVMEELHPQSPDELAATLAYHFERSDDPARAVPYYLIAAHHALAVYADEEAISLLTRALALSDQPSQQFALLALREASHNRRGEREPQRADLAQMQAIAAELGDDELAAEVLVRQISFHDALGERTIEATLCAELEQRAAVSPNPRWQIKAAQLRATYELAVSHYDLAHTVALSGLQLAQPVGELEATIEFYCQLAQCALGQSNYAEVEHWLAQARRRLDADDKLTLLKVIKVAYAAALARMDYPTKHELAREMLAISLALHDPSGEALAHVRLGMAAIDLARPDEAFSHFHRAEELATLIGDRSTLASMLRSKSLLLMRLGRHPEADTLIEQAIAIHQSLHDIAGQIKAVTNLTYSYNVQRRFAESCQVADWGVALARQIGNRHAELNLLGNLAAAEAALGEAAALEHKGMVVALKRELGVPASELQLELTQLAHMHLKLGNLDTAQRQIQEALGLDLPEQSVIIFWHFTHWTAALVMRAAGDIAASRTHLEQAYALYQQELVTITDPAALAHHMAQSTDLLAAVERGEWPAYAAPPPGSTLESEQHSPCPRCHKIAGVVKAGQTSSGGQRYRCQSCQRYFTAQAKVRGYPAELRQQATALHHAGQGVRAIARQLSINPQTVSNWLAAEPKPRL